MRCTIYQHGLRHVGVSGADNGRYLPRTVTVKWRRAMRAVCCLTFYGKTTFLEDLKGYLNPTNMRHSAFSATMQGEKKSICLSNLIVGFAENENSVFKSCQPYSWCWCFSMYFSAELFRRDMVRFVRRYQ